VRLIVSLVILFSLASCATSSGPDQRVSDATQTESVRAWIEFEQTLATMREVIVSESENSLDAIDGVEYLLVGLRSSIDRTLNAMKKSETLAHYTTREPLVGCPYPDQDYWTAPLDAKGRYRIHGNIGDSVYLSIVLYG